MENHELMGIKLVKPSAEYKESYLEAVKEFDTDPDTGFIFDKPGENFDEFLQKMNNSEKGIGLAPGRVANTKLWLVDNGKFIGLLKIRHTLNETLLHQGGHIGYGIRPSER